MRYICTKTVITKIFDRVLDNQEDIQGLLKNLQEKQVTCSMQLNSGSMYPVVRILDVTVDKITWRLMKHGQSVKSSSKISEISSIVVNTDDDMTISLNPEATRWNILDPTPL
jgi:hypothetical protein